MEKKFHPSCFRCALCDAALEGVPFLISGGAVGQRIARIAVIARIARLARIAMKLLHQVNCQACYTKYKAAQCVRCNQVWTFSCVWSVICVKTFWTYCHQCRNFLHALWLMQPGDREHWNDEDEPGDLPGQLPGVWWTIGSANIEKFKFKAFLLKIPTLKWRKYSGGKLQCFISTTCSKYFNVAGEELPRAVLHVLRLHGVVVRPVCMRCSQRWDCLLSMWHQEEGMSIFILCWSYVTPRGGDRGGHNMNTMKVRPNVECWNGN